MRLFSLSPLPTLSTIYLSFPYRRPLLFAYLYFFHFRFDMSQSLSPSTFQVLFNAALQDYEDKTGTSLIDNPFAKQLETCNSISSITTILQEQEQAFQEFRENDGELMKALNSTIDLLCAPSISSALNSAIGLLVRLKAVVEVSCSLWLFYSHSRPQKQYSLASASCSPYVSHPPISFVYLPDA